MVSRTSKAGVTKIFCSNEECPTRPKRKTRKKAVPLESKGDETSLDEKAKTSKS